MTIGFVCEKSVWFRLFSVGYSSSVSLKMLVLSRGSTGSGTLSPVLLSDVKDTLQDWL